MTSFSVYFCSTLIPRHPLRWTSLQLLSVPLQLDEIVERIGCPRALHDRVPAFPEGPNALDTRQEATPCPPSPMTPPAPEQSTRAAIDRFNEAFNRHDADALASRLDRIAGKAAVVAFWRGWFERNPDARFETEDTIIAGDRAVVRWVYRKMRNDQPWHIRGVDIFTVRDGKVAAKLAYVKG
jgi:predicted SnoaL-like aldol condensation-catalyzing enzyme